MRRTKKGVAVIIFSPDREKVLLLKRGPESRNEVGRWENPGGQLETVMSPVEKAVQKVREELGVEVEIVRLLHTEESQPTDSDSHWSVDVFEGRILRGKPRIMSSEYCSEIRWFPVSDLCSVDLASYTRNDFIRLGFVRESSPIIRRGMAVIIFNQKEDSVLLLRRGPNARNEIGKWENPGGALEPDESPIEGIRREIKEELAVTVNIERLLFNEQSQSDEPDVIWSIDVYKGSISSGVPAPQEPSLCSEIRWYRISELAVVDLTSYARRDFIRLGFISS
jgi:8-oxo-dGTP diphosphatase